MSALSKRPVHSSAGPTALPQQNKGFLHQDVFMAVSTRRAAVLLVRLRAGRTPILKAYANQLDTAVDAKCPSCVEEPQTVVAAAPSPVKQT